MSPGLEPKWPGTPSVKFGVSAVVGSGSPRYSGCSGSLLSTVQSQHARRSWSPMATPCGGICGVIHAARLSLVMTVPFGIVLPINSAEVTAVGSGSAVGQRRQTGLQGVEHPPDAPHARRVVLGDVAVEQEVAGSLLHAACAAFDLGVEALARAGVDGVDTIGLARPRPASCSSRCRRSCCRCRPRGWCASGRRHRGGGRCGTPRRHRERRGTWWGHRGSPEG